MSLSDSSASLGKMMINELADLFLFCPPGKMRRNVEDLFFNYLIESKNFDLESEKELVSCIHHLINFLHEAEKIGQLDLANIDRKLFARE